MRYLGIDYGEKKTGLALSDEAGTMGFPKGVVATDALRDALSALVGAERIDAVIIGESRDLSGNENRVMKGARALADWIAREYGLPVYWEPEVYTSIEARRPPEAPQKSRKARPKGAIDASAAALILTSYLTKHGT